MKWVTGIESDRVSFRMRHFKVLLLPIPLKGLLRPEEWEPLMVSEVMLGRIPGQRRLAFTAGLGALLWFLAIFALSQLADPVWSRVFAAATGIPLAIYLLLRAFEFLKRAVLTADTLAAAIVGQDSLLRVLARIDGLRLADVERRKAGGGFRKRFGWPDITERIEHLQAIGG